MALRRRRCRERRRLRRRARQAAAGQVRHRGRGRRRAGACARRRRQRGRLAHREGAARRTPRDNDTGIVRALDPKGLPLGEASFAFKGNERETEAAFDLPVEIRNDIARLEIAAERSSGVVQLLDKRWRRRTVGVVTGVDRRHRAAAARLDLLSVARAQPVRRCAARRARLAGRGGAAVPDAEPADADPRRRRQRRGRAARAARANGSTTAACWCASPARASRPPTTISFR